MKTRLAEVVGGGKLIVPASMRRQPRIVTSDAALVDVNDAGLLVRSALRTIVLVRRRSTWG